MSINSAMQSGITALAANSTALATISNNIANSNTTGYKRIQTNFTDLVSGTWTKSSFTSGGVVAVNRQTTTNQGELNNDTSGYSLGIDGQGFFVVSDSANAITSGSSLLFTRDGSFTTDGQGRIVNAQGNLVQPTISIPQNASQLTINAQGQVSVILPGSTTPSVLGQIGLTRFINKTGLQSIGDNLFTDTPASGPPQDGLANADGFGDIQQGNLEQSNVEVVSEISNLISAQRAYEMNAKVVSAADQMMQSTTGMLR